MHTHTHILTESTSHIRIEHCAEKPIGATRSFDVSTPSYLLVAVAFVVVVVVWNLLANVSSSGNRQFFINAARDHTLHIFRLRHIIITQINSLVSFVL